MVLHVVVQDGSVSEVAFNIFEPPRFFEGFLVGRRYEEIPDITARICGICPVAYQMTSCAAVEDAFGATVEPGGAGPAASPLLRRMAPEPCSSRLFLARPRFLRLPGRGRARGAGPLCRADGAWP